MILDELSIAQMLASPYKEEFVQRLLEAICSEDPVIVKWQTEEGAVLLNTLDTRLRFQEHFGWALFPHCRGRSGVGHEIDLLACGL